MASKDVELKSLQDRLHELERQLTDARMTIASLQTAQKAGDKPNGNSEARLDSLLANEEHWRRAILVAPFPLMIRRDDGRVVLINQAWTEISGYTLDDIPTIGEWARKAYGTRALARQEFILQEGFSEEGVKKWGEFEIRTRSGDTRIWDFSTAPLGVDDKGRRLVISMAVDVTELKKTEKVLRESERSLELDRARLTTILENMPVGIWIGDKNGKLLMKNQQADRIWAGDTPLSQNIDEYTEYVSWIPESKKILRPEEYPIAIALRTGQSVGPVEHGIRRFDGTEGTVLVSVTPIRNKQGKLAGFVAINIDITERKRMEEALKRSEERFAKAFQSGPDAIIISRMSDGLIIEANEGWKKMFGHEVSEVLGRTSIELGLFENPEDRKEAISRLQQDGYVRDFILKIRRKSGELRIANLSTDKIELNGELCLLTVLRDITEQKQAEQALQKSEAKLRAVFRSLVEGVVFLNPQREVEDVNDTVLRDYAHEVLEMKNSTLNPRERIVRPDGTPFPVEEQPAMVALRTGQAVRDVELGVPMSDGKISWRVANAQPVYDEQGTLLGVVASFFEITKRKEIEEALRQSEERFAKAFHASPDAIAFSRKSDNVITEVNEGWRHLFGYQPNEVVGRTALELGIYVHPEHRQKAIDLLLETGSLRDYEIAVRRKSGEIRQASLSAEKLEVNGVESFLIALRDITERKRAEEHIAYQAKLLANINDAIVGSDAEFRVTAWNEVAESMYGWKAEEVLGRNGLDLLQTQWPKETAEKMRTKIAQSGRWRGEATQLRKDGTRILVEVSSVVLHDEQGQVTGYVSVNRDISERKQAEELLRLSEEKFSNAFHGNAAAMSISRLRDGLVLDANQSWLELYGYTREQVIGKIIAQQTWKYPEERAQMVHDLEKYGAFDSREITWLKPNGDEMTTISSAKVMTLNGEPVILASTVDITERKRAEQALRESEERFHSLADSMPQLVWTALPDGTVDYYNRRYKEYQEIRQTAPLNWEWAPVLHPDDVQVTVDAWKHSIKTGEIYQIEHRVRMVNGSYRWHLSRGIPIRDEQGYVVRWFGTATDIHDLKLAEEKLQEYAHRLERSNRDLQEFAYVASHDLQEPLRKVEAFGAALNETSTDLSEKQKDYIERMRGAAGRMRSMVDSLLLLSRVERSAQPFAMVDLNQTVSLVLSSLEMQIRRTGGHVETGDLPKVQADPMQMQQLFQNLIGNALKFHAKNVHPNVKVYMRNKTPDTVELVVEDNGIGFPQDEAERIFQPFQRLVGRSEYEGSGMGLAICRRIVERHNGTITVRSAPGQGSTFSLVLPIYQTGLSQL